jgi:hypothetical protein
VRNTALDYSPQTRLAPLISLGWFCQHCGRAPLAILMRRHRRAGSVKLSSQEHHLRTKELTATISGISECLWNRLLGSMYMRIGSDHEIS